MAFPRPGATLGDDTASADAARTAWATTANTIAEHQPVTIVVDPVARTDATRLLSSAVDVLEAPLDDFWMRDIGPTFVQDDDGRLGAVDWVFNGWGANAWSTWTRDARIAAVVAEAAGGTDPVAPRQRGRSHPRRRSGHGAGDGDGATRSPRRNPYATSPVEDELARTIGASDVVWLPRGLTRDYDGLGTRGHVDMVATFASRTSCSCTRSPTPVIRTTSSCRRSGRRSNERRTPRSSSSRRRRPSPTTTARGLELRQPRRGERCRDRVCLR